MNKESQRKKETLEPFETFNGVYCGGFFIMDPSIVTATCLLFEKVHFLNNFEYIFEFSKKLQFNPMIFEYPSDEVISHLFSQADQWLRPLEPEPRNFGEKSTNPLESLDVNQKRTAIISLSLAREFYINFWQLFYNNVFYTSLFPDNKLIEVKYLQDSLPGLIDGEKQYETKENLMQIAFGCNDDLNDFILHGAVPVLDLFNVSEHKLSRETLDATYLASLLAMKSIKLILPQTKPAHAETILEAREKLRDHLPLFWSNMLRLTQELRKRIEAGIPASDFEKECEFMVNSIVRPSLIDLNQKLKLDRKKWFYKIITPLVNGMKVIVGKPPITTNDLILAGLSLCTNVALDIAERRKDTNKASMDSGLSFLIELTKIKSKLSD